MFPDNAAIGRIRVLDLDDTMIQQTMPADAATAKVYAIAVEENARPLQPGFVVAYATNAIGGTASASLSTSDSSWGRLNESRKSTPLEAPLAARNK